MTGASFRDTTFAASAFGVAIISPSVAAMWKRVVTVWAGATWWIETARPEPDWWEGVQARVKAGPVGAGRP